MTVRAGTPVLLLTLMLLILMGIQTPIIHPVEGVAQAGPLTWSPFGPRTRNLAMTVYGDFPTMFDAFVEGEVDITDWPVDRADEASFRSNPDFWLSDGQPSSGIRQLDINHHNPFLGVAMQEPRGQDNFNSPSTQQPTSAGIQVRMALAHLLDKTDFINSSPLGGRAEYDDVQLSPWSSVSIGGAQPSKLPQSILDEDLSDHPWFAGSVVSAYNLVADRIGGASLSWGHSFADHGYPGQADLRAACDHFVEAGFTLTPSGTGCLDVAEGRAKLLSGGQKISFYIRTHLPRKVFGQIFADGLNYLFDQPVVLYGTSPVETYFSITEVIDTVFRDPQKDDWHLYTGLWTLATGDTLFALYHSGFASNACGGKKITFPQNYGFYCSPGFDQEADAGVTSPSFAEASPHFANAAVIAHRTVMTVPVYTDAVIKFVALNGWNFQPGTQSSLVSRVGHGFQQGFWSLLNMRQKPGYVPADPRYAPGGGDPNLIRRGFSQTIHHLNPFHSVTLWEWEILGLVYDTMLNVNPLVGETQMIDWMTTRHSSSFDPNEIFAGTTGVTTQTWTLRGDLRWHDGVPLTADDVAFSLVKYRDIPSANLQPPVAAVLDVTAQNPRTVQVKLAGSSFLFEQDVGLVPIIPKHIWEPLGDAVMADPDFDPMASGKMVGSGPWVCKNLVTGAVGGSCTLDAAGNPSGQLVDIGGKVVLTAYDGYHRGRPGVADSSLHKFSWADRNNDARVDILDIADVAFGFDGPDAYWNSGQNPLAPNVGTDAARVDIGELATVAFYFDQSLTEPYSPSQVIGLDPDIDPFF